MPDARSRFRPLAGLAASLALLASAGAALAVEEAPQDPATRALSERGEAVYAQRCAACHDHPQERTPHREALRYRSGGAIVRALAQGVMRPLAEGIPADDLRALATFLTGAVPTPEPVPKPNRCAQAPPPVALGPGDWPMLGHDLRNTRHQPEPGFRASEVPRLRLKWAFAYPGGASGPAVVAGGRVFLASGTGEVWSLDAKTGCAYWSHPTGRLVRTATVGAPPGGEPLVFFGDNRGVVSALDARTGALRWDALVEEHPLAKVTAAPTLDGERLYVPMSGIEDPLQHDPTYPCCSFRGSVSALDARTGALVWKTFTIVDAPKPLPKREPDAPDRFGPAGGAIWNPLTLDAKRGRLYAATGESYDDANPPDSHAIVAYDLETGARAWSAQYKPEALARECLAAGDLDCRNFFEFGAAVALERLGSGREVLLAGQKAGFAYALDPDADGKALWIRRVSRGGDMGGLIYGFALEGGRAFASLSDLYAPAGRPQGGLVALDAASGRTLWRVPGPKRPSCSWGERACFAASVAATTSIPGAVFLGAGDGHVRAYASRDGAPLWDFDTGRAFPAVNGIDARGGHVHGWPVVAADGALYVTSGASTMEQPGNALLVFTVDGR